MNRTFRLLLCAAVAIAALTSCAKEQFKENAIPAGEPIEVSLSGQIGEFTPADATKATAESVVRVTWKSGDKVYVYDGSASIGTLTVTPDENNASYAMLSGTITASAASPSKLTLVYVKGATEAPAIAGGKISVDLSTQNQAEVPFVLYTTVAYDAAALTKTNEYISFSFATSVMTVNCTGLQTGASGAVTGIDKAEIDGVSTACELTIDGTGATAVAGTTPGTITRKGASVFTQSDSRGSFKLALAADPAAPAARNILVHQGSKVSGAAFTPTTLATGKSYNTVYQMGEYVSNGAGGYAPAVKVTGVTLGKEETSILVGEKEILVATVAPATATNKQITWSSSKPSVATVDANSGEVTGVAAGSAVITATTIDGNFTEVCLVTVTAVPVSSVSLDKTKLALYVGSSDVKLTAIFTPQNATNKAVSWSSDKTSVATVNDQGYVHAVAQGTANITVTTADGNFTAVCRVTVTPEPLTGVFRVSSNKRVRFSKGNLYYDGSNWGFESEQYYFRTYNGSGKCDANGYNASSGTASGHWGLFGWSTSSTAFGMSTSSNDSDYNGNFVDWAKALDDNGTWTTLSGGDGSGEWYYLIRNHTKAFGTCNGVPGLFIAPDNYTGDKTQLLNYVTNNWVNAQEDGIIFLPAAGQCLDSTVYDVGKYGYYWSSSAAGDTKAYYWYFSLNTSSTSFSSMPRNRHYSVRLVTVVR